MKVIYIMGAGHIGSTILDILLGAHPNIEGVGEVSKLHRSGWLCHDKRRCACGLSVNECPYWPKVRRTWADIVGGDEVARHVYLQKRFERSRSAWPRLVCNSFAVSANFIEYIYHVEALYQAIKLIGGKAAVVDSSLTPRRAYALTLSHKIDLRLIHLVRDGRGCIWSLMRPGKRIVTKPFIPAPSWRTTRYTTPGTIRPGSGCPW